jgi:hypothetical protein
MMSRQVTIRGPRQVQIFFRQQPFWFQEFSVILMSLLEIIQYTPIFHHWDRQSYSTPGNT